MRAVTFQSMVRTSSPGSYSRTSANSMPRPLKTAWYAPPIPDSRITRVRIWMRRILRRVFAVEAQGTSTRSRIRSTTVSLVTFSASAS